MQNSNISNITLKILTIGESGVGKTCVLRRFVENKFMKNHLATIGIDFKTKTVQYGGSSIKLKIWDTAGQERFRNITNQYYKGADGIALIFDVTDRKSFDKIKEWMMQIRCNTQADEIGLVLMGNKCDFESREVTPEDGEKLGQELGIKYYETSALDGKNINEAFNYLTGEIMKKKNLNVNGATGGGVELNNTAGGNAGKKRNCCAGGGNNK
jgi:Ras-related protein Rab-8A